MQGSSLSTQSAEPNLTPLLDMVFQLVTFFMLVFHFKAADVDRSLSLPIVGSAAPAEEQSQVDMLVLNLHADGSLYVRGRRESSIEGFIGVEAKLKREMLKLSDAERLPVTVVVRMDKALNFGLLNDALKVCTKNGFDRFDFPVIRKGVQSGGN